MIYAVGLSFAELFYAKKNKVTEKTVEEDVRKKIALYGNFIMKLFDSKNTKITGIVKRMMDPDPAKAITFVELGKLIEPLEKQYAAKKST